MTTPVSQNHQVTASKYRTLLGGLTAAALLIAPTGLTLGQIDETNFQDQHSFNDGYAQQAILARYATLDRDALASAEKLSSAFRSVAELAEPSVARIVAYTSRGKMTGSGFVIDARGYLVTNNHVVETANRLFVEFANEKRYPAEIVGRDPLTDLAVLRIDAQDLKPVRFVSESDPLEVGEWVVAVGCPLGLQQTVTAGIVSATERRLGIIDSGGRAGYEDFIQTDASINRGNSGGPLFNLRGEVIGVNSAILSETGGSDGLGFAIPASLAVQIVDDLMTHQQVQRGLLGVNIQDLTPVLAESYALAADQQGALITSAAENLAAYKAGLRVEDVITAINGEPISNAQELRSIVAFHKPAEKVRVTILRKGRTRSIDVVLTKMEQRRNTITLNRAATARADLGMEIQSTRSRRSNVSSASINTVIPGSVADLAGVQKGDQILAIDSKPIATLATAEGVTQAAYLKALIKDLTSEAILRLTVQRGRSGTYIIGLKKP